MKTALPLVRLSDAQRKLAEDHYLSTMRYASSVAANLAFSKDDAESSAALGLCRAASHFDPERNGDFEAYSRRRVRGAIQDEFNAWHHRRIKGGPPKIEAFDEGSLPSPEDRSPVDRSDFRNHLDDIAVKLGPAGSVARLHFGFDLTHEEIGVALGIGEGMVAAMLCDAIEALRKNPSAYGIEAPPEASERKPIVPVVRRIGGRQGAILDAVRYLRSRGIVADSKRVGEIVGRHPYDVVPSRSLLIKGGFISPSDWKVMPQPARKVRPHAAMATS